MRPIVTRPIILAVSALAAACSDQGPTSLTSPPGAVPVPARAKSQLGAPVPFRGSYTAADRGVVAPPNLLLQGTGEGNATHLGRFTFTSSDVVDLMTATGTGTVTFTAANGDQLFTTTAGGEDGFTPPNVSHVTVIATIVGGTGRFAVATGTFTMRRTGIIDFAAGTSTATGSFEGRIDLRN